MESNDKKLLTPSEIIKNAGNEAGKGVGKIAEFGKGAAEKTLELVRRKEVLGQDPEYTLIKEENKEAVRTSGWIAMLGPLMGTIGGPLAAIFNMGLDDDSVKLLGAMLLGAVIGNVIGGLIALANLKFTVMNRTQMTYIAGKNNSNILETKVTALEAKLEDSEGKDAEIALLKDELMNFRVEKKAKELNKGVGPRAR